jgi:hypothetical protein
VVEKCVGVVEDVPFGDGRISVVGSELGERPVGDVLAAVGAVFVVGVEGQPFWNCAGTVEIKVRDYV